VAALKTEGGLNALRQDVARAANVSANYITLTASQVQPAAPPTTTTKPASAAEARERVAAAQATDSIDITAVVANEAPAAADTAISSLAAASTVSWMQNTNALLATDGMSAASLSVEVSATTTAPAGDSATGGNDTCAPACIVAPVVAVVVIAAVVALIAARSHSSNQKAAEDKAAYEDVFGAEPVLDVPLQEVSSHSDAVY
jgi:hypothetical protein